MEYYPVMVIGGGLAGLNAARLLHRAGIDFKLFEARERLGGRILTADANGEPADAGFDLGASWFWPHTQSSIRDLVAELGLGTFPQYSEGDVIFHRMSRETPRRFTVANNQPEPEARRLAGGNYALISALAAGLSADSIQCNTRLRRVEIEDQRVISTLINAQGSAYQVAASHIMLAMPPRLIEATVEFSPLPDAQTLQRWKNTPTWMAPHAKFFAVYDRPFWREAGLSGSAQSMAGPLLEIHDATTASGEAALLGFIAMPAAQRKKVGTQTILTAATQQLKLLFGNEAASPRHVFIKDWAEDSFTATSDDWVGGGVIETGSDAWLNSEWRHFISLAGSEVSRTEPGFLAGAITSSTHAVTELLNRSSFMSSSEPFTPES